MFNFMLTQANLCSVASMGAMTGAMTTETITTSDFNAPLGQGTYDPSEFDRLCTLSNYALTATPFRTERQAMARATDLRVPWRKAQTVLSKLVADNPEISPMVLVMEKVVMEVAELFNGLMTLSESDLEEQLTKLPKLELIDLVLDYKNDLSLRDMALYILGELYDPDDEELFQLHLELLEDPDVGLVGQGFFGLCILDVRRALPDLLRCYFLRPWTRPIIENSLRASSDGVEILESIYFVISFSASRIDRYREDITTDWQLDVLIANEVNAVIRSMT